MKINGIEARERLYEKVFRERNAQRWKDKTFIEREGLTNGNGLCTVEDGAAHKHLTYAFAGSITEQPTQYSDTVEFMPNADWSTGSDTRAIEAKLRARKKEFSYIEVESHRHGGKRRGAGRYPGGKK